MEQEPEIQSKVPSEEHKPKELIASKAVIKLLKACCIEEILGKWQILKNRTATFKGIKFKIEPASNPSDVMIQFFNKDGKLQRPVRAKEQFMKFEAADFDEWVKLGKEIISREKETIDPVIYEKGCWEKILKIRARMSDAEKRFLEYKMTGFEQSKFYQSQPEWKE